MIEQTNSPFAKPITPAERGFLRSIVLAGGHVPLVTDDDHLKAKTLRQAGFVRITNEFAYITGNGRAHIDALMRAH